MSSPALRCSLAALALLACSIPALAAAEPVACSAQAASGEYGAVTVAGSKLSLRHARGSSAQTLNAKVKSKVDGCQLFFLDDLRVLVVAILDSGSDSIQLLYADRDEDKWIDPAPYSPKLLIPEPSIVGVNPSNPHQLIVIDSGKFYPDSQRYVFRPTFVTVSRKNRALNPETLILSLRAQDSAGFRAYVDPQRLRLWYPSRPDGCDLRSVALVGAKPEAALAAPADGAAHCSNPAIVAFPSEEQVALVFQNGNDVMLRVEDTKAPNSREAKIQRGNEEALVVQPQKNDLLENVLPVSVAVLKHEGFAASARVSNRVEFVDLSDLHPAGSLTLPNDASPDSISFRRDGQHVSVLLHSGGDWRILPVDLR